MADSKNTVKVDILDKEYLIACTPEEQAELQQSARFLDQKMKEIRSSGKVHGLERIAVMAALNITHDLLQKDSTNTSSEETAIRLATKIDEFLQEVS